MTSIGRTRTRRSSTIWPSMDRSCSPEYRGRARVATAISTPCFQSFKVSKTQGFKVSEFQSFKENPKLRGLTLKPCNLEALKPSPLIHQPRKRRNISLQEDENADQTGQHNTVPEYRSEERRVGKE